MSPQTLQATKLLLALEGLKFRAGPKWLTVWLPQEDRDGSRKKAARLALGVDPAYHRGPGWLTHYTRLGRPKFIRMRIG